MHWIQKHILKELATAESKRYIELKPKDVDGNLFMYHLGQLQTDGYVVKLEKSYGLSDRGKAHSGRLSLATGGPFVQPRIVVMLHAENESGQTLLFKWQRQPYLGKVSLPFSRLAYGESVTKRAKEELLHKAGITGECNYLGSVYIKTMRGEEIADHYLAHIMSVTNLQGELHSDGLTGTAFWGKPEEHADALLTGAFEILKTVTKSVPFFEEIRINL